MVGQYALGYNFGDGHLIDEYLISNVAERCEFAPGEVLMFRIEGAPLFGSTHTYTVIDAHGGKVIDTGKLHLKDLLQMQPWNVKAQ
mmetsp:Transcript_44239/g.103940  ORF Transcript_44239/g.103940 Transcript_44239/m.103940 type:complete len:86 (+) Transcript_44239:36-293(+)